MCGIAGLFLNNSGEELNFYVKKMLKVMEHRGPDDSGTWVDEKNNMALGHVRLSVVDLSVSGHQPMQSENGQWVIIYNGEIYNFHELKYELEKQDVVFKSMSDTEVLLEAIAKWGLEKTCKKLIGMFAFAVWDKSERTLSLVRDRLGIKPLYWANFRNSFIFASELKALRAHDKWDVEVDRNALSSYFRHNYIPTPHTIYKGVQKLLPGHILSIKFGRKPILNSYWNLEKYSRSVVQDISEGCAIEELHTKLIDSITRRMVADVPLGAFLSGGVDSSTVVAIMQAHSSKPINTFTIGFHEQGYSEAEHAGSIARHLGTNHTDMYVSSKEVLSIVPRLAEIYDEPFSDSSQIATYLVSKLTREYVTVSLSGDGGDECFAGYTRYSAAKRIALYQSLFPNFFRKVISNSIHNITPGFFDLIANLIPSKVRPNQFGHRLHKLADVMNEDEAGFYRKLISHWQNPDDLVINGSEYKGLVWQESVNKKISNFVERMSYMDMMTYLPDDILTKVDRASMAVSLEARVPLLDHRIVEYSRKIPLNMKIRNGQGKWILRQILHKYIPKELIERPKMGFGVPIEHWLKGPLREWAEELLDEKKIREGGYLNYLPIKQKWDEHISGKYNWQYLLWDVLMFQAWSERWT